MCMLCLLRNTKNTLNGGGPIKDETRSWMQQNQTMKIKWENQQYQIRMGRGSYACNYNVSYMLSMSDIIFSWSWLYCCCVIPPFSSSEHHLSSCSMHALHILSRLHGDIPVAVCAVESDIDVSVHLRLLKYQVAGYKKCVAPFGWDEPMLSTSPV